MSSISNKIRNGGLLTALVLALAAPAVPAQTAPATWNAEDTTRIVTTVQKKLASLTNYAVFDDLSFAIQGKKLILRGYASRPILKSDAANAVKGIAGVESVENQIEVLPLSNMDDRIRVAAYTAIYSFPALRKYSGGSVRAGGPSVARMAGGITNDPPLGFHAIHIIVKNGNVILRGAVLNPTDSNLVEIRANSVPGVFSVSNELGVESSGTGK
jgi:hyperosmotically inducible periplasmic protein